MTFKIGICQFYDWGEPKQCKWNNINVNVNEMRIW